MDGICERYLAWAEARRDLGKLAATEYANKAIHLAIFAHALAARPAARWCPTT